MTRVASSPLKIQQEVQSRFVDICDQHVQLLRIIEATKAPFAQFQDRFVAENARGLAEGAPLAAAPREGSPVLLPERVAEGAARNFKVTCLADRVFAERLSCSPQHLQKLDEMRKESQKTVDALFVSLLKVASSGNDRMLREVDHSMEELPLLMRSKDTSVEVVREKCQEIQSLLIAAKAQLREWAEFVPKQQKQNEEVRGRFMEHLAESTHRLETHQKTVDQCMRALVEREETISRGKEEKIWQEEIGALMARSREEALAKQAARERAGFSSGEDATRGGVAGEEQAKLDEILRAMQASHAAALARQAARENKERAGVASSEDAARGGVAEEKQAELDEILRSMQASRADALARQAARENEERAGVPLDEDVKRGGVAGEEQAELDEILRAMQASHAAALARQAARERQERTAVVWDEGADRCYLARDAQAALNNIVELMKTDRADALVKEELARIVAKCGGYSSDDEEEELMPEDAAEAGCRGGTRESSGLDELIAAEQEEDRAYEAAAEMDAGSVVAPPVAREEWQERFAVAVAALARPASCFATDQESARFTGREVTRESLEADFLQELMLEQQRFFREEKRMRESIQEDRRELFRAARKARRRGALKIIKRSQVSKPEVRPEIIRKPFYVLIGYDAETDEATMLPVATQEEVAAIKAKYNTDQIRRQMVAARRNKAGSSERPAR